MKSFLIVFFATISILFFACTSSEKKTNTSADSNAVQTAGLTYTCPMHPEVISNKPGQCPQCNMDLVEKKAEASTDNSHDGHQH
ncbi:heavy metal-binding domain-containing protein [Daejeonella oryzae]|uniref:heavy metal-binding domain-containing protein n=1 Tax=Daejeonella oryzae TaxID=1122943 RepID=UPI00056BF681|nr:heavy metal-binding domain-containing protein [Daejeonella oryzae]